MARKKHHDDTNLADLVDEIRFWGERLGRLGDAAIATEVVNAIRAEREQHAQHQTDGEEHDPNCAICRYL